MGEGEARASQVEYFKTEEKEKKKKRKKKKKIQEK